MEVPAAKVIGRFPSAGIHVGRLYYILTLRKLLRYGLHYQLFLSSLGRLYIHPRNLFYRYARLKYRQLTPAGARMGTAQADHDVYEPEPLLLLAYSMHNG